MIREEYILRVKALLEEISPFEEPSEFIAADGDIAYDRVKPIVSYIDSVLDKAAYYCLNNLPTTLLSEDIDSRTEIAVIDVDGVGRIERVPNHWRFVRVKDNGKMLKRDITAFISSNNPLYLLQQNVHTRGGKAKPVAAYVPEFTTLEIYSFYYHTQLADSNTEMVLDYIETIKEVENVRSEIAKYICWVAAYYVYEILGDINNAKAMMTEYENAVANVLQ